MNIQASIIFLVVGITMTRATPIDDSDAAVGIGKEQEVVDSVMEAHRSKSGMK